MSGALYDRMRLAWDQARREFETHGLVLPGSAAFSCVPDVCDAWCCRNLTVPVDDLDSSRLEAGTGLAPSHFLECEDGVPVTLPLVQPYVLGRRDGACLFNGPDRRCSAYACRPDACRLYPHSLLFVDAESGQVLALAELDRRRAVSDALAGGPAEALPLLLRHLECPGFTGPPLDEPGWREALRHAYALQYRDPPPALPGGA